LLKIVAFWDGHKKVAYRNQLQLIERLGEHCDLSIYGAGNHDFNKEYDIDHLIKRFDPDVFYVHFCERFKTWVPKGFEDTKIPKIMHDRNWYRVDKGWYDRYNFDLIIQCMPGLEHLSSKIPTIWMPLSFNEKEFYDHKLKRENKVLFAGSKGGKHYGLRRHALKTLIDERFAVDKGKDLKEDVYSKTLNQYTVGLSDSCNVGVAPSKVYEMMACKTAVLMTDFLKSENIFGKGACWFRYNKENIVDIAKIAIFNKDLREELVEKAYEIVHAKHTHAIRVAETFEVIEAFIKTGKIIDKWG